MNEQEGGTARPQEGFVQRDDVRLHYYDWGGAGTPLVLLHGFLAHGYVWHALAPKLRPRYRPIAPDQRGHGDSSHAPGRYRTDDLVADLAALVDQLGLGRCALLGFSLGGAVAARYAAQRPEQVERLAIVDIGPRIGSERPFPAGGPPEPASWSSVDEATDFQLAGHPYPPDRAYLRAVNERGLRRREDGRFVWKWDPALLEREWPLEDPAFWAALRAIRCPVLVVRGAESFVLSDRTAREMVGRLPDARSVVVPRARHAVHEENPAAFEQAVREFFGV
jgi:pimeloyl-ACP methyl ester carboxylesterase